MARVDTNQISGDDDETPYIIVKGNHHLAKVREADLHHEMGKLRLRYRMVLVITRFHEQAYGPILGWGEAGRCREFD